MLEGGVTVIAVVEAGGGLASGLSPADEPHVLASDPGQADDVTGEPTYVVWAPLPDDVDVVAFRSGRLRCWQRPVSGVSAFPWPTGYSSEFTLAAFDSAGTKVLRHGDARAL